MKSPRNLGWLGWVFNAFLLISLTVPPSLAQSGAYSTVELGALRGGSTVGRGLNANGDIVGRSGLLHGTRTTAFLWTRARKIQSIGNLPDGDNSRAIAINSLLQVVGVCNTATSLRAFLW